mmetsp:Transcript_10615/g.20876  ORF Transcript_10615/g.20876 Transcript_10615/m.20876 type:complete len:432 (-) Transcript_10615:33-1328(-)
MFHSFEARSSVQRRLSELEGAETQEETIGSHGENDGQDADASAITDVHSADAATLMEASGQRAFSLFVAASRKRVADSEAARSQEDEETEERERSQIRLAKCKSRERLERGKIAHWERFLVVGIACVDTVDEIPAFPSEDSEMRSLGRLRRVGGNGTNLVRAARQFDQLACGLMYSSTPDHVDPNAAFIRETLTQEGIGDVPIYVAGNRGQIPASFILQSRLTGSRTIIHYRDIPELRLEHLQGMYIPGACTWAHFEGRSGEEVSRMLAFTESECTVSLEIEKPRPPYDMLQLLRYCDVVMIGKDYVKAQGFDSAPPFLEMLWAKRKTLNIKPNEKIVVPWGERGAYGVEFGEDVEVDDVNNGPEIIHVPAVELPGPIIDSVGAGDVFNGSLIVALLRGHTLREAMVFGCCIAGNKCTQQGIHNLTRFVNE